MRTTLGRVTGPLTVTCETTVDSRTASALWDLFTISFAPLEHRAAARQLLSRDDFNREVLDSRVAKYLARSAGGELLGLATLSNDLDTVPWISPGFYQTRYPVHFARNAVFYCGIAMVHPDVRSTGAFAHMISAFSRDIAAADGILAADMCRFNVDALELPKAVTLILAKMWGSVNPVELDQQIYMAWEPGDRKEGGEISRPG